MARSILGWHWRVVAVADSGCLRGRGGKHKKGTSCMLWATSTQKNKIFKYKTYLYVGFFHLCIYEYHLLKMFYIINIFLFAK